MTNLLTWKPGAAWHTGSHFHVRLRAQQRLLRIYVVNDLWGWKGGKLHMSYALGIPVPLDHFSDDVVTLRRCFAQLCDGEHCAALLPDHFQARIPSYAAQDHLLENIQSNLEAHGARVEQAALVERARECCAHLSQYEAAQLTQLTPGGYERYGYDAWDSVYNLVRTTVKETAKRLRASLRISEGELARCTFHVYDTPISNFRISGSEEDQ